MILTKYIGSDSAVSVAPRYVINDEVYNTVLDSTTVFALNTKITSAKLARRERFIRKTGGFGDKFQVARASCPKNKRFWG